jgi:hypothetical protein
VGSVGRNDDAAARLFLSSRLRQASRAATIAERFADVPPLVKTPKAPSGMPVNETIHFIA